MKDLIESESKPLISQNLFYHWTLCGMTLVHPILLKINEGQLPQWLDQLRHLRERHEILRSLYRQDQNGQLVVTIMKPQSPFIIEEILLDDEDQLRPYKQSIPNDLEMDLAEDGPLLAKILRLGEDLYLWVGIHHVIFDGRSLMFFFNDLIRGVEGQEPPQIEISPFSYLVEEEQRLWEATPKTYPLISLEKDVLLRKISSVESRYPGGTGQLWKAFGNIPDQVQQQVDRAVQLTTCKMSHFCHAAFIKTMSKFCYESLFNGNASFITTYPTTSKEQRGRALFGPLMNKVVVRSPNEERGHRLIQGVKQALKEAREVLHIPLDQRCRELKDRFMMSSDELQSSHKVIFPEILYDSDLVIKDHSSGLYDRKSPLFSVCTETETVVTKNFTSASCQFLFSIRVRDQGGILSLYTSVIEDLTDDITVDLVHRFFIESLLELAQECFEEG